MKPFKVRDFRNKQFFLMDDAYLNGYAKKLGVSATCVYLSLCRHADKEQQSFPSQELIAKEHNMSPRTVWVKLKELEDWSIIRAERTRNNKGKWLNNTYILLDKSEWKDSPFATIASGNPFANNDITHSQITVNVHSQPLRTKDTHNTKDTHIKETHTLSLSENDFLEIAERYQVPIAFVRSKYDDMTNWCASKGKKYKDYKAALRNWVKQDAIKLRKEQNGKSKLVLINPE